jgi:hypothetical protein
MCGRWHGSDNLVVKSSPPPPLHLSSEFEVESQHSTTKMSAGHAAIQPCSCDFASTEGVGLVNEGVTNSRNVQSTVVGQKGGVTDPEGRGERR